MTFDRRACALALLLASCARPALTAPTALDPAIRSLAPQASMLASRPTERLAKRCAWQWGIVTATLSYTGSAYRPDNVREVQALVEAYRDALASHAPGAAACGVLVEDLLADLGILWGHMDGKCPNDGLDGTKLLLRLQRKLFPYAAHSGYIAYALGTAIAITAYRRIYSPEFYKSERWREEWIEAAQAFHRAGEHREEPDAVVYWQAKPAPMREVASLAEARARAMAEIPVEQRDNIRDFWPGWAARPMARSN
jgi:hypothetical protein